MAVPELQCVLWEELVKTLIQFMVKGFFVGV